MLKQLPQGSSRNDCTMTDVTRRLMAFPTGLPKNVFFFSRKAFKDLEDAIAQHDSNNDAFKKAKDWPIQKAKQGEKVFAFRIFRNILSLQLVTPRVSTLGRPGRKTGRRWMPPLRRPRKPWRRPVRKLIRLMS